MPKKPQTKAEYKAVVDETVLTCYKCKTTFTLISAGCPNCGCKTVQVSRKDPRQAFVNDNRQAGPQ